MATAKFHQGRRVTSVPSEPEISWNFRPRIEPGEYPAFSRSSRIYRDPQFNRWVCAVQFDVLNDSLTAVLARLTWFLNLGSREKPCAGRRGNYWAAWVKANNGPPQRKDRISPRAFEGRQALVQVKDTAKNHQQVVIGKEDSYSIISDIVRWETGGQLQ